MISVLQALHLVAQWKILAFCTTEVPFTEVVVAFFDEKAD
jgi:hypothetical protein